MFPILLVKTTITVISLKLFTFIFFTFHLQWMTPTPKNGINMFNGRLWFSYQNCPKMLVFRLWQYFNNGMIIINCYKVYNSAWSIYCYQHISIFGAIVVFVDFWLNLIPEQLLINVKHQMTYMYFQNSFLGLICFIPYFTIITSSIFCGI